MGVSYTYVKHSLKYHPVGVTTAVILGGLRRKTTKIDSEVYSDISDAELYPDHLSISSARAGCEWSSVNVGLHLATLGTAATCISTDGTHPGLVSYWQKRGCAGPASGSVHRSITLQNGVIVPQSLNVRHRSPAEISYMFRHIGATAPVDNVTDALPTLPATTSERYDLYSATIGGNVISGKLDIGLAFNAQMYELGSDSEIYDSFAGLKSESPVITFRNFALANLGSVDLDGLACAHADSNIVLKKRNTALTAAEHIRITFQGLGRMETMVDGNGVEPSEEVIVVNAKRDASNGPFVVSTTYAIA